MIASEIDPTFAAAMKEGLASEIASMDLAKTLEDVAKSESVGDYQATRLSTLSVPELKAAVQAMSESRRWNAIKACLTAARQRPESVERLKVETVATEMVKELALGSTLNRVRIERKFNLKFPSDQSP